VSDYAVTVAAIITICAVIYAVKTYVRNRKLEQIKLLDGILRDIKDMQKELVYLLKEQDNTSKLDEWDNRFFNTCEWLAFLINTDEIKDDKMEKYFEDTLFQAKSMFDTYAKDTDKSNAKRFPELKKLFDRYKNKV
jgi:hypothetical protein